MCVGIPLLVFTGDLSLVELVAKPLDIGGGCGPCVRVRVCVCVCVCDDGHGYG